MASYLSWDSDIASIKGIGDKKKERLNAMGITSVGSLLDHIPFRYKDRRSINQVLACNEDEDVLVSGKLLKIQSRVLTGNRSLIECSFRDSSCNFNAAFFNMPYLKQNLTVGKEYAIFGRFKNRNGMRNFSNPEICELGSDKDKRGLVPVYRCTAGVTNNDFMKWISACIDAGAVSDEWIDSDLIKKHNICDRKFAYQNIHFPTDKPHYQAAKYRIVYEKLLTYQLALKLNRLSIDEFAGDASIEDVSIDPFINELPFELTEGQKDCISDIEKDMISTKPMNRLVQGDVGCGKTVVAEAALYKCAKSGFQGAMMAPTEILARQHYKRLKEDLEKYELTICLLVSGMKAAERREAIEGIMNGNIDIVVGTHAIIQEDVVFKKLGLVITDEQHRFGVNQRKSLVNKGCAVNTCVMSATPIPRTLAATVFGDMDFSIIRTKPSARKEIITRALDANSRERAYVAAQEEINKGHQVYVVAPSIDSVDDDISSVEHLYAELKDRFRNSRIALIHGKMSKEEKDGIMSDFSEGRIDMLVATIVIEVGIDVPNASVIIIENSERFGLAQMHQLRGRVGRSDIQSYCYIINYSKNENSVARAKALVEINDGFELSEEDYRLRGPGDVSGTMQSGNYQSGIIALCAYSGILDTAIKDAEYIMDNPGKTNMNYVINYIKDSQISDNSNIL